MALDLARTVGWAAGIPGETPRMDAVTLAKGSSDYGAIGAALDDWLTRMLDTIQPTLLVFEAPLPFHKGIAAGRIALGLAMVTEMAGYRRKITTRECGPSTVRARVLGNGRAKKEEVVAWCKAQGWNPKTHDTADAAALWVLACRVRQGTATFATGGK